MLPFSLLLKPVVALLNDVHGRYLLVIGVLTLGWWNASGKVVTLREALAAKPKIEYRERVVEKRVKVAGPVRVVTKTVYLKDGTKTVEKVREQEAVTTVSDKAAEIDRKEEAACPPPVRGPWRAIAAELSPKTKRTAARFDVDLGPVRLSARHPLPFAGELSFEPWVGVGVRF